MLVPMMDLEALKAAGILYPNTQHAWRWLYRHRHARGVANGFRCLGRRIVVDTDAFKAAVRAQETAP